MDINNLAKLILFVGITVSCVGISYQIMRLLSAITDNVKDLRKTVKNIGVLSDGLIENQKLISEGIEGALDIVKKVRDVVDLIARKIVEPITVIFGFLSTISGFFGSVTGRFGRKKS